MGHSYSVRWLHNVLLSGARVFARPLELKLGGFTYLPDRSRGNWNESDIRTDAPWGRVETRLPGHHFAL